MRATHWQRGRGRGLARDSWLRIAERQAEQDVALADPRAYLSSASDVAESAMYRQAVARV